MHLPYKEAGDKGIDKLTARKARCSFVVMVLLLGLASCAVFYWGDLWFTYAPLVTIMTVELAWAAAFITTPLQIAGTVLLGTKEQRQVYRGTDPVTYYTMVIVFVLSIVADIGSNVWGLFMAAAERGTAVGVVSGSVLVAFAVLFAIIEIIAGAMVQAVSVNMREARRLREALATHEKEHKREARPRRKEPTRSRDPWADRAQQYK